MSDYEALTYAEKIALYERVEELVREQVNQRLNQMKFETQIARLQIANDDVLVLQTDLSLDQKLIQQLRERFDEHVRKAFPHQTIRTLVLVGGVKLSIGRDIPLDWKPV